MPVTFRNDIPANVLIPFAYATGKIQYGEQIRQEYEAAARDKWLQANREAEAERERIARQQQIQQAHEFERQQAEAAREARQKEIQAEYERKDELAKREADRQRQGWLRDQGAINKHFETTDGRNLSPLRRMQYSRAMEKAAAKWGDAADLRIPDPPPLNDQTQWVRNPETGQSIGYIPDGKGGWDPVKFEEADKESVKRQKELDRLDKEENGLYDILQKTAADMEDVTLSQTQRNVAEERWREANARQLRIREERALLMSQVGMQTTQGMKTTEQTQQIPLQNSYAVQSPGTEPSFREGIQSSQQEPKRQVEEVDYRTAPTGVLIESGAKGFVEAQRAWSSIRMRATSGDREAQSIENKVKSIRNDLLIANGSGKNASDKKGRVNEIMREVAKRDPSLAVFMANLIGG